MKSTILAFSTLFIFFSFQATAQNARLQAGINLANVSVTDDGKIDEANMLSSFQVGILGDINLGDVFALQSGLLFSGKGSKTQKGNPSDVTYSKATSNPYYLELPVNLLFRTPLSSGKRSTDTRFFIGAGPYLAVGVSGKMKNEGKLLGVGYSNEENIEFSNDDPTTLDYEEGAGFGILKRFDYGLNGTAGLEGKSIVFCINYGLGLAKIQSGSNSAEDNNNKHRVLGFSLGFKL